SMNSTRRCSGSACTHRSSTSPGASPWAWWQIFTNTSSTTSSISRTRAGANPTAVAHATTNSADRAMESGCAVTVSCVPCNIGRLPTIIRSGRGRGDVFQSRPHRWKHLEHLIEAADLKYFLDHWLQSGNNHLAVLLPALFPGNHEHPQAGAADINQSTAIQQQLFFPPPCSRPSVVTTRFRRLLPSYDRFVPRP